MMHKPIPSADRRHFVSRKIMPRISVKGLIAIGLSCWRLVAQTPSPPEVFEVASIKRADPKDEGGWVLFKPGGRLEIRNSMLTFIIQRTYGVRDFQVVDGPKWIYDWTYRFNIDAKAAGDVSIDQVKGMTRAMLAERFQLKVHRETRELPVLLLTVSKSGARIKPVQDGVAPYGRGIETVSPGLIRGQATIDDLIRAISAEVDRPILDRTEFHGLFDFRLDWAPINTSQEDVRSPLPKALQEQLGLKLEAQKAPAEVLVIDHVTQPSGN